MCRSTENSMAISWHMLERLIGARAGFGSVKTSEKCPDHKSECPSETTCCQMQSGLYGCCPFKDVSWRFPQTSGKRWLIGQNISFGFSILLQWFALFGYVWVRVCYDSLMAVETIDDLVIEVVVALVFFIDISGTDVCVWRWCFSLVVVCFACRLCAVRTSFTVVRLDSSVMQSIPGAL